MIAVFNDPPVENQFNCPKITFLLPDELLPDDLLPDKIIILMVRLICSIFLINLSLQPASPMSPKVIESATIYAVSELIGFYSVLAVLNAFALWRLISFHSSLFSSFFRSKGGVSLFSN
jgi:hypothetical protein